MLRIFDRIFIMKTFKELLFLKQFSIIQKGYCSKKSMNFIINSLHLQPLKDFMRPNIKNHLLTIFESRRNKNEILFVFKTYPVCLEFNKYHSKELLKLIHANNTIAKVLNLQQYTKITGYVPKNLLLLTTIQEIKKHDFPLESAKGNFTNNAKDKQIYEMFEEIREVIKSNHKNIKRLESQHITSTPSNYYIGIPKYNNTRK